MMERRPSTSPAAPHRLIVFRPTLAGGGADRVTITLLANLDRRHFQPELVLLRAAGPLAAEVPSDVPLHELRSRRLRGAWWPLARLLRRRQPDAVLCTSSGANSVMVVAWILAGRPGRLVLSERSSLRRTDRPRWKARLLVCLKRWLYRHAHCVLAVSHGVSKELEDLIGLQPERVRFAHSPLITAQLLELASVPPTHEWFCDNGPPVVLAVGRLVKVKGFDLLLEAFAQVRRGRDVRLVIFGEGPQRRELEVQIRALGLTNSVRLPGFDPNPYAAMARCSIFVLSSHFEGMPGVLIQALACGATVVATDCQTGPAEILIDGVNGRLVPAGNADALAAAIGVLLDDENARHRLASRSVASVAAFCCQSAVGEYSEALEPELG